MRNSQNVKHLKIIEDAVMECARDRGRELPEVRFFVLSSDEFMCLLEKGVYPKSPPNLWEGQNIKKRKQRVKDGQESSIYYEVVQTGDPSYAYLNHTNSDTIQASVMAHVVGHCEFSEINVLKDSEKYRTEYALYLSRKCEDARQVMGYSNYFNFWNDCESMIDFVYPNSRFNLENSVETESNTLCKSIVTKEEVEDSVFLPFSTTMGQMFNKKDADKMVKEFNKKKDESESISRRGYKLKMPCQDVFGFLNRHAPLSASEKKIMDYKYFINSHYSFIRNTQIMNEGWAMYWEKEIMEQMFKDKVVKGIIGHCKTTAGVMYPRPFFQRNPYHLGFHMWHAIKKDYEEGKITSDYRNEKDLEQKVMWKKDPKGDSLKFLESIVKTTTDYGFLKRFLTKERVTEFHLNRIPKQMNIGASPDEIINEDKNYIWLDEEIVKSYMLNNFVDWGRPQIYLVNDDYNNGGLLLFHKHSGQDLKEAWIKPTLKNLARIWHNDCYIVSNGVRYSMQGRTYNTQNIDSNYTFDEIIDMMKEGKKVVL